MYDNLPFPNLSINNFVIIDLCKFCFCMSGCSFISIKVLFVIYYFAHCYFSFCYFKGILFSMHEIAHFS